MNILYRAALVAASMATLAASVPAFSQQEQDQAQGQHQWQGQRMTPEQRTQRMAERFAAADTNHDGKLSLDEAKAGMPMVARHFDEIDSAHTGGVTLEQMNAYAQSHMGQRRQGGANGGSGS